MEKTERNRIKAVESKMASVSHHVGCEEKGRAPQRELSKNQIVKSFIVCFPLETRTATIIIANCSFYA